MKTLFFILIGFVSFTQFVFAKDIEMYGFIKAAGTGSTKGVESLGRNNFVAYTGAANPIVASHSDHGSSSMQVQQSRLGVKTNFEADVTGVLEVDFVDFNKSTPTVGSVVRLRRAFISYNSSPAWTFNAGQDWDLFSPYSPFTYNYIGHYFLSGDTGFMRLQGQAIHHGDNNETAVAIGFPSYNNQSSIGNPEWTALPTLSLRQTWTINHWSLGASGIVGHIADTTSDKSISPYALNIFSKHKNENSEFVFEAYYGENLENLSLQALSYSPQFKTLKEIGAYSTYHKKYENWGWFVGAGYSHIFNRENLSPSYTKVAGKPTLNLLTSSTGYGILENATVRIGYENYLTKKLNFYTEIAHLYTHHLLDATDSAVSGYRSTEVFEVGLKLDI